MKHRGSYRFWGHGLWRTAPKPVRILSRRPRLALATLIAVAIYFLLPRDWHWITRALLGWDCGVVFYLALIYGNTVRSTILDIRQTAVVEDEGAVAVLALTVTAALASLAAIIVELGSAPHGRGFDPLQLTLALFTVSVSWAFIHTIFALHYAHEFYGDESRGRGLNFPGHASPNYWDFIYFSFVIGMTFQVSDVAVESRRIRQTVTAHGIVAFFFNVALLALAVNIAASAI
ncbi:MAG TPA: DUF1345 domain-containing protein [Xanthobacteraceae bacterium]|nr:DUF1345 domain-containing protein [Xanthobacteraceae bacterium]